MTSQDQLMVFVQQALQDDGVTLNGELTEDTSLLQSGLIGSLTFLNLVAWVEDQVGGPIDLMAVDPIKQWDTMRDIRRFCAEYRRST
jgi:acyl carrier protein